MTVLSDDYPTALRTIHQMPPVLLVRGRLVADERAVSVVGSRGASDRGLAIAGHVVRGLVARDISVCQDSVLVSTRLVTAPRSR